MKLSKAGSRIKSANDFIDLIASKSSITGKPYQVILKNGSVINLRDLLYHELKKLNKKSQ
jgi:DNA polymerase elongation subunit (family B)